MVDSLSYSLSPCFWAVLFPYSPATQALYCRCPIHLLVQDLECCSWDHPNHWVQFLRLRLPLPWASNIQAAGVEAPRREVEWSQHLLPCHWCARGHAARSNCHASATLAVRLERREGSMLLWPALYLHVPSSLPAWALASLCPCPVQWSLGSSSAWMPSGL